jgi:hypothetical protein
MVCHAQIQIDCDRNNFRIILDWYPSFAQKIEKHMIDFNCPLDMRLPFSSEDRAMRIVDRPFAATTSSPTSFKKGSTGTV